MCSHGSGVWAYAIEAFLEEEVDPICHRLCLRHRPCCTVGLVRLVLFTRYLNICTYEGVVFDACK
jgi:hypothetical protein